MPGEGAAKSIIILRRYRGGSGSNFNLSKNTMMLIKNHALVIGIISELFLIGHVQGQMPNTLTDNEAREGWQLLFNGRNLKGWHSYLEKVPGRTWQVHNGTIVLDKYDRSSDGELSDLVTDSSYTNFDLRLEWKMDACSNSGVLFYVHESPEFKNTYETGPEMQIADLDCNDDGRILKCRAGDLYDLVSADTEWVKKGGQWNDYEIVSDNGHLTFFMNGHRTIDMQLWNDSWRALITRSKFTAWPAYGTFREGHLALQGTEPGKLWFRNIRLKRL